MLLVHAPAALGPVGTIRKIWQSILRELRAFRRVLCLSECFERVTWSAKLPTLSQKMCSERDISQFRMARVGCAMSGTGNKR